MNDLAAAFSRLDELQNTVRMNHQHQYQGLQAGGWVTLYGTTSVIGLLGKPALETWKLRQERDHMAKIAFGIRPEEDESKSVYAERLQAAAGEFGFKRTSTGAADRGHRVHAAVEAYLKDATIPQLDKGEQEMLVLFQEWWSSMRYDAMRAEVKVANFPVGYAGTADMILQDKDGLILADLKTSKASNSTYPEHSLQSAAYRGALYELGFPPMRGLIIQVDRNGGGVLTHWLEPDITQPFDAFKGLVKMAEYLDARDQLLKG